MKLTDIQVNKIYAVPLSSVGLSRTNHGYRPRVVGTAKDVSEGSLAAPIRVIAVGKFRWQRQGACDSVVANDHYETTIHAETLDFSDLDYKQRGHINVAPGMPGSKVKLTDKSLKWREVILRPGMVTMPWDAFIKRYEENRLAALEMSAYTEKHQQLIDELKTRVATTAQKKLKLPGKPTVQFYSGGRDGASEPSVAVTLTTSAPMDTLLTAADKKLRDEILDLEERMKCNPRQRMVKS